MPISKKQLRRMVLFVGELKTNSYPNSYSFAEKLRNLDIVENQNINCTARTVQRDIQTLRSLIASFAHKIIQRNDGGGSCGRVVLSS